MSDASSLAPALWGIPVVADAASRDAAFPLATRSQDQRVFNKATGNIERWSGSAWVTDLSSSSPKFVNVMSPAYGAKGDGTTDDASAIDAALAAVPAAGGVLYFPTPTVTYLRTTTFSITRGNIDIVFDEGASITFSGTGVAFQVDGTGVINNASKVTGQGISIIGTANCTKGFRLLAVARSRFTDIRVRECSVAAHSLEFCVAVTLDSPRCTTNDGSITTKPASGLVLDRNGVVSNTNTTDCTIINPIYEGLATKIGIDLQYATDNQFEGGTSEANGTGINVSVNASGNQFDGTFCEQNTTTDLVCAGYFNAFYGAHTISAVASDVHFTTGAYHNVLVGGQYNNITIDAGVLSTVLDKVAYAGTLTDNGAKTQKRSVWNIPGANYDPDTITRRLLVGTVGTDTSEDVQVGASLKLRKLVSAIPNGGAAPTITAGAGAGTGPTVSMVSGSNDTAGQMSVVTGTTPTGSGARIANVTFNVAAAGGVVPSVVLFPASIQAALLAGATGPYIVSDNLGFYLNAGSTALTATATYLWNYVVVVR